MHPTVAPAVVLEKPLPLIRRLPPKRSLAWLSAGWTHYLSMAAPSAILSVTLLGIGVLVQIVTSPRIAGAIAHMLLMVFFGIISHYYRRLDLAQDVPSDNMHIYRNGRLWMLAVLAAAVAWGFDFIPDVLATPGIALPWIAVPPSNALGWYSVVMHVLSLPAYMAFSMAPALIVFDGVGPLRALKLSLAGSLKNMVPWLPLLIMGKVLLILAILPLGLGLIVFMPLVACIVFAAYEDIFNPGPRGIKSLASK